MPLSGLNETIDQLIMAVCWYGHVLSCEECHVLRWALDYMVNELRKK